MRSIILMLTFATAILAVAGHWVIYHDQYGPAIATQAHDWVRASGVRDAAVSLDYFDITLKGTAPDETTRLRAETAILDLPGLRLKRDGNHISVAQRLELIDHPGQLQLQGWLQQPESKTTLQKLLTELRPDLHLDLSAVHVSPHVKPSADSPEPLTNDCPLIQPIIASLRVPVSLSITRDLLGFTLAGYLPSAELKQGLIAALRHTAPDSPLEHSQLAASPHVISAPFAEDNSLADFVASFFSNPSQAAFHISSSEGVRLQGSATRDQESRWLSQLRTIAGGLRVEVDLHLYPSPYHLPGYQPISDIDRTHAQQLRTLLEKRRIHFLQNSSDLSPEEASVLASITSDLLRAGPGLRLLVASHPQTQDPTLQLPGLIELRLQTVIDYLVQLGLPPNQIRPLLFQTPDAESIPDPESSRQTENVVELLIE